MINWFNHLYPYTNVHELNLDWVIAEFKAVHDELAEVVIYVDNGKLYIDGKLADATKQAEFAELAKQAAQAAQAAAENSQTAAANSATAAANSATASANSATQAANTVSNTLNQVNLLQSRVDNIIPYGTQTEGNTELLDIRVEVDGTIASSAGDAVRQQVGELETGIKFASPVLKYIVPMFLRKAISTTTGEVTESSTANVIFPCFLDNLQTIKTSLTDVEARVFYYGTTGFSDYKGFVKQTLTANTPWFVKRYPGASQCMVLIHFTNNHNFSPEEVQTKVLFGVGEDFNIYDPRYLVHNNLSSTTGNLGTEYNYRYCFPFMFNVNDIYKISAYTGNQVLMLFYNATGDFIGKTAYYSNTSITKEAISTNLNHLNDTATYCSILFGKTNTSDSFTTADYGNNIYIASDISDEVVCDTVLLKGSAVYGGERINLSGNKISFAANVFNIGYPYSQDADVYNNYCVRVGSNGLAKIYDLVSLLDGGGSLAQYTIPGNPPHGNAVFFGVEKYTSTDDFPLLYVNAYNEEHYDWGTLLVYRVQYANNVLTLTQVQTIKIGFYNTSLWSTGSDNRPYGNFAIDKMNNKLIAYTVLDGDVNVTRVFTFDMPAFVADSTVTLTTDDIVEYFDTDKQDYPQGCECYNGKLYALHGFSSADYPAYLSVVDMNLHKTVTKINLTEIGLNQEPECIFIYNGQIVEGYLSGNILNV